MSTKENPSEEIDLGQLFTLIGDTFNRLFQFIGNCFKGIFHIVILFFQFIQKHFLKFIIAGIVGLGIGWYLDSKAESIYRSSMIVQPNFDSTQQLYNNIKFYNELAAEGVYKTLATALKISDEEASTITKIEIEAFSDDNQKLKQFSNFVSSLDSVSRTKIIYEDYLKNFNNINSRFHKISFHSIDPVVAKKCQNTIVQSIENNSYFSAQKATYDLNMKLNEATIIEQLKQVDSLNKFYQKLKLLELKKPEGTLGTNINLASDNENANQSEIILLDRFKSLSNEIIELNAIRANTENIINVISDFPDKGTEVNDFIAKRMILFPLILIGLIFIILCLLSLNRYLKNYSKDKK